MVEETRMSRRSRQVRARRLVPRIRLPNRPVVPTVVAAAVAGEAAVHELGRRPAAILSLPASGPPTERRRTRRRRRRPNRHLRPALTRTQRLALACLTAAWAVL